MNNSHREWSYERGHVIDATLVTLWDAGIEKVKSPNSLVPRRKLQVAEKALGLPSVKEQMNINYWLKLSDLSRKELERRMAAVEVIISPNARKIPRNSLSRFRRMFLNTSNLNDVVRPIPFPSVAPTFTWEQIGEVPPRRFLTASEIEAIHNALEVDFLNSSDPISPPGIREPGLLSSAAHRPMTEYEGHKKYPTVEMAGAALFHSLILNHAFHNGNKRTALVALLAFLDENGFVLTCDETALFRKTLRVAQHGIVQINADRLSDREVLEIARWLRSNIRTIQRGDYPMKWHKLKARLREFSCTWCPAPGVGNRLNIERVIIRQSFLKLRNRKITLKSQVAWSGDKTEVDRDTIHKIRKNLQLDDFHDVDSTEFYRGENVDRFIIQYRRILKSLARL